MVARQSGRVMYHYTNTVALASIRREGLRPMGPLVKGRWLPSEARRKAIEGLLEPEPSSWTENPEFPFLWGALMKAGFENCFD